MAIENHSSDFTSLVPFWNCFYPVNILQLCWLSLIQAITYLVRSLRRGSSTPNWCHMHTGGISFWGSCLGPENIPIFTCLYNYLSDFYNSYHWNTSNFITPEQTSNSNFYVLLKKRGSATIFIGPIINGVRAADGLASAEMDFPCS